VCLLYVYAAIRGGKKESEDGSPCFIPFLSIFHTDKISNPYELVLTLHSIQSPLSHCLKQGSICARATSLLCYPLLSSSSNRIASPRLPSDLLGIVHGT
jgi:hypothetical protein